MDLEIAEEYTVLGERRYVVRIKGTNISFNVGASNPKEAIEKVKKLLGDDSP